MMPNAEFYIYMLLCVNGSLYTGYTTDLERRYREHVTGTCKSKYTRSFKPISMAQNWKIRAEKSIVLKIEHAIKTLSKKRKHALINSPHLLAEYFPAYRCYITGWGQAQRQGLTPAPGPDPSARA